MKNIYNKWDIQNNLSQTIDLRSIIENEKEQELIKAWYITDLTLIEKMMIKFPFVIKILILLWLTFLIFVIMLPFTKTNANEEQNWYFLSHFPTNKTIIWCYNDRTKETRESKKCNKLWDHNIKLPPRWQIKIWLKYYNEFEIINRLALVNFESDFEESAENPYARWYVQTLKKWNISPDIDSQLNWMKNRNKTYSKECYNWKTWKVRWCGYYWNNYNTKDWFEAWEYWVLSCLYRYHYNADYGIWYAKRWVKVTKFYKYYMFWIK